MGVMLQEHILKKYCVSDCNTVRKLQKFRESIVFTQEITKELISRNIFLVRENFAFFHTVWKLRKFTVKLFWQIFRESNAFTK